MPRMIVPLQDAHPRTQYAGVYTWRQHRNNDIPEGTA
jgi:hypothetical protein